MGGEDMAQHRTNFPNHLRSGEALPCPVELGVAGFAAVCMANESWRIGRMIGWDVEKKRMAPADPPSPALPAEGREPNQGECSADGEGVEPRQQIRSKGREPNQNCCRLGRKGRDAARNERLASMSSPGSHDPGY
jgi:hypothetical protein